MNQPRNPHQVVAGALFAAIHTWVGSSPGRGAVRLPLDVKLDERNVFAPDILWYDEGMLSQLDHDAPYPLPHIAVEVRSASTWRHDIGAKMLAYERAGLPELWLVDTVAPAILVLRRSAAITLTFDVSIELGVADHITSPQLPGFALPLASLFAS